ncbi:MAG: thiol peroxidase [Planctomycetota bacterium]
MRERTGLVTMQGAPVTLLGEEVRAGEKAPDFVAAANDLSELRFSEFRRGKACIVSSVPSLDTPVCDMETRRFNAEAEKLAGAAVLTISMDLPFAQRRWCGAAGVKNVTTVSDHREASFGLSYGVLIKGVRLLARAVFVVDREGIVRHVELVREVTQEPDYAKIIEAAKKLT